MASSQYGSIAVQGIYTLSASSTSNATTTSATQALLTGMTVTPIAGTYQVFFDTSAQSTTGGNSITFQIYNNGAAIANSSRTIQFPTATLIDSGYPFSCATQANGVTVNGAQAITVEWSTNGGTATCLNRTLTVMKIG